MEDVAHSYSVVVDLSDVDAVTVSPASLVLSMLHIQAKPEGKKDWKKHY